MPREYTTKKKEAKTVELVVDGRRILWTKPKDATIVMPMVDANGSNQDQANVRALFDWFGGGLSDEDEKWIEERLRDPHDDFDVEDLNGLAELIVEELSGVPPTSRNDSGSQLAPTGSSS